MKHKLLSESAYSADLSIDTLDSDEIELVNQCIDVLNREKCILANLLAVLDDFKGSFCTLPPYEVIDSYLETRLRIGEQNWWSHTDSVRGLINTHKFSLDEWSLKEV